MAFISGNFRSSRAVSAQVRVRQYYEASNGEYYPLLDWQEVEGSGEQELQIPIDRERVARGGRTYVEWRFARRGGEKFDEKPLVSLEALAVDRTRWGWYTRTVLSCEQEDNYRYGFNGIEKTNEISGVGNHYGALFGEYDPRTAGRWNLDPKPVVGVSPYSMFGGNPIWKSDPLLDSAWAIKNQWDRNMTEKYQKEVPGIIGGLQKSGQKFTCDDLALTAVMTFAKDNALPFKWETGSGTFDAASDKYSDFATFKQDVITHSGAPDFQRGNNAFPTGKNSMFAGGIMLLDHRNSGRAHHVQVVTKVVGAYSVAAQSYQNAAFVVKQGNFRTDLPFPRFTGSGNPQNSLLYLGVPIQTGFYDLRQDRYENLSTGSTIPRFSDQLSDRLEFRLFNFSQWNK